MAFQSGCWLDDLTVVLLSLWRYMTETIFFFASSAYFVMVCPYINFSLSRDDSATLSVRRFHSTAWVGKTGQPSDGLGVRAGRLHAPTCSPHAVPGRMRAHDPLQCTKDMWVLCACMAVRVHATIRHVSVLVVLLQEGIEPTLKIDGKSKGLPQVFPMM